MYAQLRYVSCAIYGHRARLCGRLSILHTHRVLLLLCSTWLISRYVLSFIIKSLVTYCSPRFLSTNSQTAQQVMGPGIAKRVLRYLKGTADLGIVYRQGADRLRGYVDADWGNNLEDRKSYSGYAFVLANGAITWESKKQRTVALSSTEAEYMALTEATKEAIYLQNFLKELGCVDLGRITLFNDNAGAAKIAENPVFHSRTKHIDIRHHFVREALKNKDITLEHISTKDMAADVLTKPLARANHQRCLEALGMNVTDDELAAEDLRPQLLALIAKNCPALEELNVTAINARPSAFRELAASVTSLRDLSIGRCTNCSDIELGRVLEANKALQGFSAQGTDFSGRSLLRIATDLKLIESTTLPRSMESMEFVGCNPRPGNGAPQEEDVEAEQEEAADFFEFDLGPVEMAVSLPSRYPLVTELGVAFCGWVDNTFIGEVGRHMKHLIKLDITGCTNIRGQFSLEALSGLNHCTELQISLLFPDVSAQFLRDMSSLRELTCRDTQGVTDEDVCGLVRNSATIAMMDLEGCVHIGRPFIDCVYSALRGDPHNHRIEIHVGGTSAVPRRRDRQLLHVFLNYTRHSKCPYV